MPTTNLGYTVAQSAFSRVFVIEGGARPDHAPVYNSCLRMQGITQGFGDLESIECPDPFQYGKFISVGSIRGATERPTTTLEGRYALDAISTLLKLARQGCNFDIHLHFGQCTDPSIFSQYKKAVVLRAAQLTNFTTEDLGVLVSGDNAAINESAELSGDEIFELVPLTPSSVGGSVIVNEVLDVVVCDAVSCGDCENESSGCDKIYAVTKAAGGSPATAGDVVFSLDGGSNWFSHDIDSSSAEPDAIACVGDYVVVVTNAGDALEIVLKDDLNSYTDPDFTEVTTGIVAAGSPNDIWSVGSFAFIVGDGGYIYKCSDPASGVEVLDAGSATTDKLLAVHALNQFFAVAVGNDGAVVYSTDGALWTSVTRPVGVGINLTSVWIKGENEWLVTTSDGRLFYTLDKGTTWVSKAFSGSGAGVAYGLAFANSNVGYLSHSTATPRARVFRTIDGGYSWNTIPEETGTCPLADRVNALAACSIDPNFVVGVGLDDDATDGFIVVGSG